MEAPSSKKKRPLEDVASGKTLEFDGRDLTPGTSESLRAGKILRHVRSTDEGINIQGAYASLVLDGFDAVPVVFKKLQNRATINRLLMCDSIKPCFGLERMGALQGRMLIRCTVKRPFDEDKKKTIGRGDISFNCAEKPGLFVFLKRLPGKTLTKWVQEEPYKRGKTTDLWVPWDNAELIEAFLPVFIFRMIVGITDPGSGNFLVSGSAKEGYTVHSVDEASAFSEHNAPRKLYKGTASAKWWLEHNAAPSEFRHAMGKPAIFDRCIEIADGFKGLATRDRLKTAFTKNSGAQKVKDYDYYVEYVLENLRTFREDLEVFTGRASSPSMAVDSLIREFDGKEEEEDGSADKEEKQTAVRDETPSDQGMKEAETRLLPEEGEESSAAPSSSVPQVDQENAHLFPDSDIKESYYRVAYDGNSTSVVKSALQKCIRRGLLVESIYWATVMVASNHVENLVNRLLVMGSEDIGLGNSWVALYLDEHLHKPYLRMRAECDKKDKEDKKRIGVNTDAKSWRYMRNDLQLRRMITGAVIVLCRTAKSRICDNAAGGVIFEAELGTHVPFSLRQFELDLMGARFDMHHKPNDKESWFAHELAVLRHIGRARVPQKKDEGLKEARERRSEMVKVMHREAKSAFISNKQMLAIFAALVRGFEYANAHKTAKLGGSMQLVHMALMLTRPLKDLPCEEIDPDDEYCREYAVVGYTELITGETRMKPPECAYDKHTAGGDADERKKAKINGAVDNTSLGFFEREEKALNPKAELEREDHYYQHALKFAEKKDEARRRERFDKKI